MDLWLAFLFVVAGGIIGATLVAIVLSLLISRK